MMKSEVRVWDPLIRIFHWSLVMAFFVAYLTGDEESNIHIVSGYVVLGLITFRVVWGLIGTQYARFTSFVYSPRTVFLYLKDVVAKKPQHYIGHNPAGGAMVIVMLLVLIVVSVSGLKVYALEEGLGPLAADTPALSIVSSAYAKEDDDEAKELRHTGSEKAENFWEEIHEASSNLMLLLIFLHISGVFVSAYLHNEQLVKAMFTGKKVSKLE